MPAVKTRSRKPQPRKQVAKKAEAEKDVAKSYNKFKEFEGKQYTGMKVARAHKWY